MKKLVPALALGVLVLSPVAHAQPRERNLGSAATTTTTKPETKAPAKAEKKAADKADRVLTIVNHEYEGTKQWLPGTILVKKGERVELQLINNTPSGVHGFQIEEFGVKVAVSKGKTEKVQFTADKAGLFNIKCHLHPAHVGGQLWVID